MVDCGGSSEHGSKVAKATAVRGRPVAAPSFCRLRVCFTYDRALRKRFRFRAAHRQVQRHVVVRRQDEPRAQVVVDGGEAAAAEAKQHL
jgi:hypothetical protein